MSLLDNLVMNLQYFAADDGSGGGNGDPDPNNAGSKQTGTDNPEHKSGENKTFSQEDVNSIAAKEAKKAQEKLFKEVGIEDFENAKEGLQKFKEWQDSQKTESEKQQEALQSLQGEKETLTKTVSQLEAQISAMKAGVNGDSVEDVIALAERLVTDDTTMDKAIEQVIKKYPQFSAQADNDTPTIVRPGNPNGGKQTVNPFSKENWNLTEQGKLYKENPELYKQLKSQAGK